MGHLELGHEGLVAHHPHGARPGLERAHDQGLGAAAVHPQERERVAVTALEQGLRPQPDRRG